MVASELYDHTGDTGVGPGSFDDYEFVSLAARPERQAQVQELAAVLRAQFDVAPTGC